MTILTKPIKDISKEIDRAQTFIDAAKAQAAGAKALDHRSLPSAGEPLVAAREDLRQAVAAASRGLALLDKAEKPIIDARRVELLRAAAKGGPGEVIYVHTAKAHGPAPIRGGGL